VRQVTDPAGTDGAERSPSGTALAGAPAGRLLLWVMLAAAAAHAAALTPHWWFQRDSALYLGLARSLADDGTYVFNGAQHAFALPGFPLMLAPIYATLGESFLAMNVLVALFSVACLPVAYALLRASCSTQRCAAICFVMFAASVSAFRYSRTLLADTPFAFLALVCLYCGMRSVDDETRGKWAWTAAAAAALVAASATRPFGPALLAGLLAAVWGRRGLRERWRGNLAQTGLLVLPFVVLMALYMARSAEHASYMNRDYYTVFLGRVGPDELMRQLRWSVPALLGAVSWIIAGADLDPVGGVILAIPMAVGMFSSVRRGDRLLAVWGLVYLAGVCVGSPNRRHLVPVLPVLLLWLVEGMRLLGLGVSRCFPRPGLTTLARVGYALAGVAVAVNLAGVAHTVGKAHAADFYNAIGAEHFTDYPALAEWLRRNAGEDDVVIAHENRLVHYTSGLVSWRFDCSLADRPADEFADRVREQGIRYIVRDRQKDDCVAEMDRLMARQPEAFEEVDRYGHLVLYRVETSRL
jgi:4-amino-4-deoxy-L-arabinose transferase-like glycosyltransferase